MFYKTKKYIHGNKKRNKLLGRIAIEIKGCKLLNWYQLEFITKL